LTRREAGHADRRRAARLVLPPGLGRGVQLFLVLRYAELHGDAPPFAAFLAEVAAAEDQEGVEAEEPCDGPDGLAGGGRAVD
jgi:hypothetical protein